MGGRSGRQKYSDIFTKLEHRLKIPSQYYYLATKPHPKHDVKRLFTYLWGAFVGRLGQEGDKQLSKSSKWTKEEHNYLIMLRQKGLTWQMVAEQMTAKFGKRYTRESCRSRWRHNRHLIKKEPEPVFKETVEIKSDGTQVSDKLVEMSEKEMKDPEYILLAHGYDPKLWDIINVKMSHWHYRDKETPDGKISMATRLAVKPKKERFDYEEFIEKLKEIKPIKKDIPKLDEQTDYLLEIPLFDQHFGVSDYEYYKDTQSRIHSQITVRQWKEILFVIGSDMLHNDNFKGTTTKGTVIEQVDMEQAWEDASLFYEPLIDKALEQAGNVKVIYSPGNHDEAMSWAFVKYLKARFPQCEFDDKLEEHKIHVFGETVIGITHGDKGKRELHNVFAALFPVEWGTATTREIHTGHFHVEDAKDKFGTMVRTLATRNKTDTWHKRNGYVGAHKRFMLFEYSKETLESIHYV